MHIGKAIRLERIFNRNTGRTIIVPMDHGVTVGPIAGLEKMRDTVTSLVAGGANAGLVHKGQVKLGHRMQGRDFGCIVHLSAGTCLSPFPNVKRLVTTVEEAIRLGADGVSVHVNLGDETEGQMLSDFGRVAASAAEWGMPLLAMIYARGPKVGDEYDPDIVAHCARVGAELGADVVKVNYPGSAESFARVVECTCVPVVIAGGAKMDSTREFLDVVRTSIDAGGAGLSVGRNVFQHRDPTRLVEVLNRIVHEGRSVDDALDGYADIL
ncbi:2-amino-3,7-dideoxy-D-threo-hept-6-ulosonate synthase [Pseudodesulfovibrio portus]|uniref:2-amino-3,7-dideoxy-D-threo-hept-6-ulosonate synthase n=1 Tax=Pseudodesulfovibrio portus TaxID=231439 RepID=A0ABM8ARP8_9BACT|nr:2-amino-3,7-dideoxy-D-threo-hept-6-ulosonate synthase [Pseudodesulfovibrio portus]BDQ34128.1 2-amino-3,7-dideoxy-D-threo-hept-6-ulosonate synthase [Pseudodesulfovibrio portus]